MRNTIIGAVLLLVAITGFALDVNEWERIIVPVSIRNIPGAYGSLWTTEFWVFNSGSSPVNATVNDFGCAIATCNYVPVPPGAKQEDTWIVNGRGGGPGVMLYVEKAHASDLTFSMHLRDLSRQAQTFGTEIPIIRERDFLTNTTQLFPVPTDDRFRQTLRIYDADASGTSRVRVRIFRTGTPTDPLAETELTLVTPATGNMFYTNWPYRPGYAEILWLSDALPAVRSAENVRIEIEPLTPGLRYWAFVSITNNETQHVTLVTPAK